ncbi:hypothetical protein [Microseira sp. BLCC-F43]|jgi:hypothetical protein|uniref:hypothetical protein n=1 Tax=Microseira sp. BLCC-F43 TaxID=3153602 RepID=UPI0035BACF3B
MTTPEFSAELERAIAVANQYSSELLRRPGVVAVGAGVKRRAGLLTGQAAVVITVREKLSLETLPQRNLEPLPQELDGLPVDVIEFQKPVESEQIRQAIEQAIAVKDRVADSWLQQENVTGIGVGYKVKDATTTNEIAIQIFVQQKLPATDANHRGWQLVPPDIDGVPTDVVQLGPFTESVAPSGSRANRKDPLLGGLAIGHASSPFTYGTLGAIVFDNANNPMVLSNEHVLDGDIGETVHQPSPVGLDDSFEIGFQLDVCHPANFVRIDTPDTVGGSILAGAAAAVALAAALSDEIDPTREGQQATPPPDGAITQAEYTKVKLNYHQYPLPGTPFQLEAKWEYERRTNKGILTHAEDPSRQNPHTLLYHRLFSDRQLYAPTDTIELFGVLIPCLEGRVSGKNYHCIALLRPNRIDKSYPIVLRSIQEYPNSNELRQQFFRLLERQELTEDEKELLKGQRRLCIYYGEFSAAGVPLGSWFHWMHVQTINTVPPGTDPLVAAQTIGGLAVSNHYRSTLDIACGPFVFEDDGSFDIELLSLR